MEKLVDISPKQLEKMKQIYQSLSEPAYSSLVSMFPAVVMVDSYGYSVPEVYAFLRYRETSPQEIAFKFIAPISSLFIPGVKPTSQRTIVDYKKIYNYWKEIGADERILVYWLFHPRGADLSFHNLIDILSSYETVDNADSLLAFVSKQNILLRYVGVSQYFLKHIQHPVDSYVATGVYFSGYTHLSDKEKATILDLLSVSAGLPVPLIVEKMKDKNIVAMVKQLAQKAPESFDFAELFAAWEKVQEQNLIKALDKEEIFDIETQTKNTIDDIWEGQLSF